MWTETGAPARSYHHTAPPLTPRAAALPFPPRVPFVPHLVGDRRAPLSALRSPRVGVAFPPLLLLLLALQSTSRSHSLCPSAAILLPSLLIFLAEAATRPQAAD